MNTVKITLTREVLYKQVWAVPTVKLARIYGLSDVGFAKMCKRNNIPKPPNGYWAKIKHGKKVKKEKLPQMTNAKPIYLYIRTDNKLNNNPQPKRMSKFDILKNAEKLPDNLIIVPNNLEEPHPLIAKAQKHYKHVSQNKFGRKELSLKKCLDIQVFPNSIDRALKIMNALILAIEKRGFSVVIDKERSYQTYVHYLDEEIPIYLYETARIRKITPQEKAQIKDRWERMFGSDFEYVSSGVFSIHIGYSRKLQDTKIRKLENCLNLVIIKIIDEAVSRKKDRKLSKIRKLKDTIYYNRRDMNKIFNRFDNAVNKVLETQSENWHKSQQIREYIEAIKEKSNKENKSIILGSGLHKWIKCAEKYADTIDPLE